MGFSFSPNSFFPFWLNSHFPWVFLISPNGLLIFASRLFPSWTSPFLHELPHFLVSCIFPLGLFPWGPSNVSLGTGFVITISLWRTTLMLVEGWQHIAKRLGLLYPNCVQVSSRLLFIFFTATIIYIYIYCGYNAGACFLPLAFVYHRSRFCSFRSSLVYKDSVALDDVLQSTVWLCMGVSDHLIFTCVQFCPVPFTITALFQYTCFFYLQVGIERHGLWRNAKSNSSFDTRRSVRKRKG